MISYFISTYKTKETAFFPMDNVKYFPLPIFDLEVKRIHPPLLLR